MKKSTHGATAQLFSSANIRMMPNKMWYGTKLVEWMLRTWILAASLLEYVQDVLMRSYTIFSSHFGKHPSHRQQFAQHISTFAMDCLYMYVQ